jgi:hypothetical protein
MCFRGNAVKWMPLSLLAAALGVDKGNLSKKLKREGVPTKAIPFKTTRGVRDVLGVQMSYARREIKRRLDAEKNTESAAQT